MRFYLARDNQGAIEAGDEWDEVTEEEVCECAELMLSCAGCEVPFCDFCAPGTIGSDDHMYCDQERADAGSR